MPTRFLMCRTVLGLHPRCEQIVYRPLGVLPAHKMLRQFGSNLADAYTIRHFQPQAQALMQAQLMAVSKTLSRDVLI